MGSIEERLSQKLRSKRYLLCTVESCTGGLISNLITNLPGSSEVFWGSFVVYDNSSKINLGVSDDLISKFGAVSSEVAIALAESGLKRMGKDGLYKESYSRSEARGLICVSTTGVAGPGGGSPEKPVGLCWIGLATSDDQKARSEKFLISQPIDRVQNKAKFAERALEIVENFDLRNK